MKRSMKGFSLCCARMRPIQRNMPGGKVFFRFSHVLAAVVIPVKTRKMPRILRDLFNKSNTFDVTGVPFLQRRLAVKA
jgi:hypothetical protein